MYTGWRSYTLIGKGQLNRQDKSQSSRDFNGWSLRKRMDLNEHINRKNEEKNI